ncbi:MAG: TraR/DksA C4-type zinc finger protein [Longimicrobiales bacterium]|nr:TraR/DksA C4-type zinc finger protein [Longimicrobiales bacterium]
MSLTPDMLEDLRAELERQLRRLEKSMAVSEEASRPVELDQQAVGRLSRMDSLQSQHMSQNLHEREQARYSAVRAALDRMDAGEYGVCVECEAEIEYGRLMVVPEAEHCPRCAG